MTFPSDRIGDRRLFAELHAPGNPLVLPNAWDIASAVLIERAGAKAIATTSAGIAWSRGYPDGNSLTTDELLSVVRSLRAAVSVPLTIDIEGGFDRAVGGVVSLVSALFDEGVVGINLEDSWAGTLLSAEEQADRVKQVTAAVPGIFVNARIDTYLLGGASTNDLMPETLERARAVIDAGASGVFIPGLTDLGTIASVTQELSVPLNVMVEAGSHTVRDLANAGVGRISTGASLPQSIYAMTLRAATRILNDGLFDDLKDPIEYGVMNGYLTR